ncbi:Peptidase M41 [Macleaya cordata]|uniref:Peptidase M41 n=1 Tax=Macleaya cordata TaxID=56857 RepID=A0A200QKF0_MACCD|nr:Peptidase M41 [Macleaya cordata]
MASTSTTNPILSSTFLGTQLTLSPPTPKTTKSSLPLSFLSKRKFQISQSLLNKKPNSNNLKNLPSQATIAALIFSISQNTPSAIAIDNPPSSPPPVIQAEAIKPNSTSSPFSQNLLLTAPKPQTQSTSDLPDGNQWRYSEFLNAVKKGKVERVRFSKDGGTLQLTAVDGRRAFVTIPNDPDLIDILASNGVDISVSEGDSGGGLFSFIGNLIFPVLAFAGLFLLFRRAQGGPGGPGGLGGPMDFGRSKSKFQEVPETGVSFADVAGADQAKLELQEVVDFLKNPDKYTALGAKIPKGCLLVGPPGTGKTLLARAVAGEAGVPFFSCAASEFVELFVGVGASRVRDLFEKAKSKAPCIVFIDEIDAVGRQRGAGLGGGNDEREQTINQLLTEMDGFSGNSGVIILAATNRPDVLDSALLRPGRFDRQVTVDRPDVAGRVKILQVHSRGKALAKDVDFDKIARRTPGFTGADLQNLMNEAAILAARRDLKEISKDEISDALERIIAGPEKKNAVVSEEKKKLVAYHEAGHALVGALMPEYDPVAKISIIPRGQAGGLTFFAPSEERLESGLYSKSYLENQMAVALGGRVAEEVIFGTENVTTGASNDFMQVSRVARQMVERFGFSKKIGQVAIGGGGGNPFLGQQMSSSKDYSMATADVVDAEVRELVEKAYTRATQIITTHIDILHKLAQLLIEKETVDGEEFMSLFIDGKAELYVS